MNSLYLKFSKILLVLLLNLVLMTGLLLIFSTLFNEFGEQHFAHLSESFLHGKTYFLENPKIWNVYDQDTVLFQGKYYWPLGPFPAIAMMPFVGIALLLGFHFGQTFFAILLFVLIFMFLRKIANYYKYSKEDSSFLVVAFCFSSALVGIIARPFGWYIAQDLVVFIELLFIYLFLIKNSKANLSLGILASFALMTRITAGFSMVVFWLLYQFLQRKEQKTTLKEYFKFCIPVVLGGALLLLYNYLRFGNFLETGYNLQIIDPALVGNRDYGLYNLGHLPANLYYFFLASPAPVFRDSVSHVLKYPFIKNDNWGMSIFLSSPYLVYLYFFSYKDSIKKPALLASAFTAFIIFLYYGIGYKQFGYRYALDFFPFLFLIFISGYKEGNKNLSARTKLLILAGAVFNLYLFFTHG